MTNYLVKYQFLATMYSKERALWPGIWHRPDPYISPHPWNMKCDQANTTCTISLAGRHCKHVPGWNETCSTYYGTEYEAHEQGAVWKKTKEGWRRSFPPRMRCAKAILGHGMIKMKHVNGKIIPYVADIVIIMADGHAFRKSLCAGEEIDGFEWIGPNCLYSNETSNPPEEHWLRCGRGLWEHECTWTELIRGTVKEILTVTATEIVETIGEGAGIVGGWISGAVSSLFNFLWPYLLLAIGFLTLGIIACAVVKKGALAAMSPCGKKKQPHQKHDNHIGMVPLLWKGEE